MKEEDIQIELRKKQGELVKVVEAFASLEESKEWATLKELVFDKSLASIERQLLNECLAPEVKVNKIYRLQGEWAWAKQYNNTHKFVDSLKKQLEDIKERLK